MSIRVLCQSCSHEFHRPEALVGKMVKCPECKKTMIIPDSVDFNKPSGSETNKASRQTPKVRTDSTVASKDEQAKISSKDKVHLSKKQPTSNLNSIYTPHKKGFHISESHTSLALGFLAITLSGIGFFLHSIELAGLGLIMAVVGSMVALLAFVRRDDPQFATAGLLTSLFPISVYLYRLLFF